jgi:hypothetical protein
MSISVVYVEGGTQTVLDTIVISITWSGDTQQAMRKLEVSLQNVSNFYDNGAKRVVDIKLGKELRLLEDSKELFRGVVFATEIDLRGHFTCTAYDEAVYLTKNSDSKKWLKKKASDIVSELCSEYGIATGSIEDTGYVIPKMIIKNKSLYEHIITALTETRKNNGRTFKLIQADGKLNLYERKKQVSQHVIENGVNLIEASYSVNMDDMRTKVKVIGGKEDAPVEVVEQNSALIADYGIMQHVEEVSDDDATQAQMQAKAKELLEQLGTFDDEAEIECLGITEVISGTAIYVKEPMTNIMGGYYVTADTHSFEGTKHIMSLTLSATDDIPTMKYEE